MGHVGLYIYGSVGSGKSLLMDMFYAAVEAETAVPLRRRIHFNAAMLEVLPLNSIGPLKGPYYMFALQYLGVCSNRDDH